VRAAALANKKRLLALLLMKNSNRMSLNEFHHEAHKRGIYANPETSYRNLEILTEAGFLRKEYDQDSKTIYYRLDVGRVGVEGE